MVDQPGKPLEIRVTRRRPYHGTGWLASVVSDPTLGGAGENAGDALLDLARRMIDRERKEAADAEGRRWEPVTWDQVSAGDTVSLNVFSVQHGWERETRRVVAALVDGKVLLDEAGREYEYEPATDPHGPNGGAVVKRDPRRLVA